MQAPSRTFAVGQVVQQALLQVCQLYLQILLLRFSTFERICEPHLLLRLSYIRCFEIKCSVLATGLQGLLTSFVLNVAKTHAFALSLKPYLLQQLALLILQLRLLLLQRQAQQLACGNVRR